MSELIAITGGEIWPITGERILSGTILIEGAKIVDVYTGQKVPEGATVVDAAGLIVLPGFIDAHCHVGLMEEIFRVEGDDANETTDPVLPHLRALDGINPADEGFIDALSGGVTTVVVAPGSANVIGGEMVALKTAGRVLDEMVLKAPVGMKAALGENPKRTYGSKGKAPLTRMAAAALLREALVAATEYHRKWEQAMSGQGQPPERNLKMESLVRVLKREIPLRVHAHRADDIMTAVRIAREFDLELIIEHCTEGHLVAEELARAGVKAVVGPLLTNRAKVELMNRSLVTAAVLKEAGVPLAIMTDHPVVPVQHLTIAAGLAIRGGLDVESALKAITIDAARLLGLEDRIGSIEAGKDADLVLMKGMPFDLTSRVVAVYVNGRQAYPVDTGTNR